MSPPPTPVRGTAKFAPVRQQSARRGDGMTMTWGEVAPPPRRSRRRAVVFLCALVFALAGSLAYVYTRPAEYRALARLQIAPAACVTQPADANEKPTAAAHAQAFLTRG